MFDKKQSIAQQPPSDPKIKEIQSCLSLQGYISQYNILFMLVNSTISQNIFSLDQALPSRLDSYIITNTQNVDKLEWVSQQQLEEIQLLQEIDYKQIQQYAHPLAIESKSSHNQYQMIQTQSNMQVGLLKKKPYGLVSNQIVSSKINSRSLSPLPMNSLIKHQESQIVISKQQDNFESKIPSNFELKSPSNDVNNEFTYTNPSIQSIPEQFQNNHPVENLFQDPQFAIDEDELLSPREESQQIQSNQYSSNDLTEKIPKLLIIDQFNSSQLSGYSPKTVRQVQGKGLSPPPIISKNNSKSPEIQNKQIKQQKQKWNVEVNQQLAQKSKKMQPQQMKLADHFKSLLNDSTKRNQFNLSEHNRHTEMASRVESYRQLVPNNKPSQIQSTADLYKKPSRNSNNCNTKLPKPNINKMLIHQQSDLPRSTLITEPSMFSTQNQKIDISYQEEEEQPSHYRDLQSFMQEQQFTQQNNFQEYQFKQEQFLHYEDNNVLKQQQKQQQQNQQQQQQQQQQQYEPKYQSQQEKLSQNQENLSIRDQFSFKPTGISPQAKSPIQIKLNIQQFMNSNKPHQFQIQKQQTKSVSPIQRIPSQPLVYFGEKGRPLYINVNLK